MSDDNNNVTNLPPNLQQQMNDVNAAMQTGGHPEREPIKASGESGPELVQEIPTTPELEKKPDLAGYIEKVEKAAELTHPVLDDYTNQVLLGSANPQNVKVTLPLSEPQIEEGLHHKIWEGIRWLAEWCLRQMKIIKTRPILDQDNL